MEFQAKIKNATFQQAGGDLEFRQSQHGRSKSVPRAELDRVAIHTVLVLDDPVQSMDARHVVWLADVLRAIMRQEGRQLVLTVHEHRLFDYLCLELAPTREGQSLMAIEIVCDPHSFESTIQHDLRVWQSDNLRFESA